MLLGGGGYFYSVLDISPRGMRFLINIMLEKDNFQIIIKIINQEYLFFEKL